MKASAPGAISGCIVGILLFMVLGLCLLPLAFIVGTVTSTSSLAIQTTGQMLCPQGSTPTRYSYATVTRDDNGNTQPSTAYELHCVDATGQIVKQDPIVYGFLWIGMAAGAALIVMVVLTLLLAAPAGLLLGRLFRRAGPSNPPPAIPTL